MSEHIKTGVNFRIGYVDANDNTRGNLDEAAQAPPWQPIYNDDGTPAPVQGFYFQPNLNFNPNDATTGAPFNIQADSLLYGPETSSNFVGLQSVTDNRFSILRNLGTGFVEVEPLAAYAYGVR